MYIRKIKSRNSICLQVGYKRYGKFVLIKHVGCTSLPSLVEALKIKAKEELEKYKFANQLSLLPDTDKPTIKAKLLNWKITGFHHCFGCVYDLINFPQGFLRDLVVARIVYPKSKLATARYLTNILGIPTSKDKIYRFMDSLSKNKLTKIAFDFVSQKNKGISLIFYDVTTLYFEIDKEDDFREKGYSKDHRSDIPQILIGLFVDKNGYPFDYGFFKGKTFEGHTFQIAIKNIIKKYNFKSLTVVADAGMLSKDNLDFLVSLKLNYIVGARVKNLSDSIKKQFLSFDFKKKNIKDFNLGSNNNKANNNKGNKRLIIAYSQKRAKKDKFARERTIKKLKEKLASGKQLIRKSKYLMVKNNSKISGIDYTKIKQDEKYDGLRGYHTNLKNDKEDPESVIAQYRNLWKVEKAFRMSKSDLRERPVYHQKQKRIKSHLLLCFCSLLVMKESEKILSVINCSLAYAIEVLSTVGEGRVMIGKTELPIEKKLSKEVQQILDIFEGH